MWGEREDGADDARAGEPLSADEEQVMETLLFALFTMAAVYVLMELCDAIT